ncbi:hypothetical protein M6B38_387920 [Iris pallida]|uniref:Uncharacterized protein n=1 Tax=Iris pallida TaxID=29817 RepID=A0AAX6FG06_IRIPA|nr:hypothetical protein M6B38_141785 [Iris pallida]KAJ6814921.1 hypothetical protein M6B38_137245 [Iris pallida]KAJ6822835.1 hypothetical protein M6B38_387920 [Iris pallida]
MDTKTIQTTILACPRVLFCCCNNCLADIHDMGPPGACLFAKPSCPTACVGMLRTTVCLGLTSIYHNLFLYWYVASGPELESFEQKL